MIEWRTVQESVVPKSRGEAEELARRGAGVAARLAGAIAARDTAVVTAGSLNKDRIERLTQEKALIAKALETWARTNRAEFSEKKELQLKGALLKFRASTFVDFIDGWNWEKTVQCIVRAGRVLASWKNFIRIEFNLDKQSIRKAYGSDPQKIKEQIAAAGLKMVDAENFSIEFQVSATPGAASDGGK